MRFSEVKNSNIYSQTPRLLAIAVSIRRGSYTFFFEKFVLSRFHRLAAQIAQNETEFKIPYIEGRSIKLCILDQKLAETRSGSRSQFTKPGNWLIFLTFSIFE